MYILYTVIGLILFVPVTPKGGTHLAVFHRLAVCFLALRAAGGRIADRRRNRLFPAV